MLLFQKNKEKDQYIGPARSGFTFTYSPQLNASLLFGGAKDADVYLYDHNKKNWSCKSAASSKKTPRPIKHHSAAILEQLSGLIVFGGQDESGHSVDDLHILSFRDWKWKKTLLSKMPLGRQRHALIPLSKSQLLLFGGVSMPYNEVTNDCWVFSASSGKTSKYEKQESTGLSCSLLGVKGAVPEGMCASEGVVLVGDRLFCASQRRTKGGSPSQIDLYCLELRSKIWKKLDLKFISNQLRFWKILSLDKQQTLILSTNDDSRHQDSKYYLFNHRNISVSPLELGSSLSDLDTIVSDVTSIDQTVCLAKGKRIFTARYWLQQPVCDEPIGTIEDYLIAIKHQQLLSQELGKKNVLLEQLYKQIQNYITNLNQEYVGYQCDLDVQAEKGRHIQDCQHLKTDYTKLNSAHEEVTKEIRVLRGQLSSINEDFQRCIQTEFDQQA